MGWKIDEIDRKIIEILRENARMSNEKLGKKVSLSEPATRRRVSNLVERGVIKRFTIDVEEGGGVQALIFISISPDVPSEKIADAVSKKDGIHSILEISGETDFIVSIYAVDMDILNARIDEIRHINGIKTTKTSIIMKKWK